MLIYARDILKSPSSDQIEYITYHSFVCVIKACLNDVQHPFHKRRNIEIERDIKTCSSDPVMYNRVIFAIFGIHLTHIMLIKKFK